MHEDVWDFLPDDDEVAYNVKFIDAFNAEKNINFLL